MGRKRILRMTRFRVFAILGVLAAAGPAWTAEIAVGTPVGTSVQAVRAAFVDMGLRVGEVEIEGPRIEAEVVLDGRVAWIYVDRATGDIMQIDFD